jgi:hypothetical protein
MKTDELFVDDDELDEEAELSDDVVIESWSDVGT